MSEPDDFRQAFTRRRTLAMLFHGALAFAARPALARASRQVVVMTSYPEEVMSRFEAAFEAAHPEYRLRILWRMPHDALPYLRQPGQGGVDVYWSASPRTYARLKAEGAFQPIGIDRDGLPVRIGQAELADPDGYYLSTEMAGYGFAINAPALAALGVAPPTDWRGLADPRLAGKLVLPNPARVGFAPVMVDIVLQAYGWARGWALWSELAGLARLVNNGGTLVSEEIATGRGAIGLSIDFFVASSIANGAPLRFVYPEHGGINPAHIAVTAGAANPEGARAFASFVLSSKGQRLLAHPDIRKLPVRPAVYAELPADYPRPFEAAARGAYEYDGVSGRERLAVVSALFDQTLAQGHATLVELWSRIHAAEKAGRDMSEARRLLAAPPIDEGAATAPALTKLFRARVEGASETLGDDATRRVELDWQWHAAKARSATGRWLEQAGA